VLVLESGDILREAPMIYNTASGSLSFSWAKCYVFPTMKGKFIVGQVLGDQIWEYCWWKISQTTTWYVKSLINTWVNYLPQLVQDFWTINSMSDDVKRTCKPITTCLPQCSVCSFFLASSRAESRRMGVRWVFEYFETPDWVLIFGVEHMH